MLGEQAYQNALRRRDDLQREIDRYRAEVEQINSFLELCAHFAGMEEGAAQRSLPAVGANRLSQPVGDKRRRRLTTVSGMALLPHIRRAILETGRPIPRGAIVQALEARGIRVGGKGKNPAAYIGTVMWRASNKADSPFIGLAMGYWPRDVACAAAGYESHQEHQVEDEGEPEERATAIDRHEDGAIGDEPGGPWEQAAKGA